MKRSALFIAIKIIILQSFFVTTSIFAPQGHEVLFLSLAVFIMLLNYLLIQPVMKLKYYLFLMFFFFCSGFIQDTILLRLGLLELASTYPPIWFATLWLIFLGYYGDVFNRMLSFPIWLAAVLGSIGGTLAYYRGISMIGVETHEFFYPTVAGIWACFMPFSLRLFRYFMVRSIAEK